MGVPLVDSIEIVAEPTALFQLSQDYSRRLDWDPFLKSAGLSGGAREAGVGVRALCVDRKGTKMETEYVSFNPPRAVAIKMTRGPWFLKSFAGSWRFEESARAHPRGFSVQPGSQTSLAVLALEPDPRPGLRPRHPEPAGSARRKPWSAAHTERAIGSKLQICISDFRAVRGDCRRQNANFLWTTFALIQAADNDFLGQEDKTHYEGNRGTSTRRTGGTGG